jgi:ubiquitin-activating enzyme E1
MQGKEEEIDANLYSRQIGTFGMETMGKLIKMRVCIAGIRGLGVEIAKNLILAGPKEVLLYDPDITRTCDLGANFYLEKGHVGKVSRAEGVKGKLNELNPYVKVTVITDLEAAIKAGDLHVLCQTEMLLAGKHLGHNDLNKLCRENKVGYLGSQTFGPWGFAFVDYGDNHVVTDHNGEQTKNFVVSMIEKGEKTLVTVHEDKRHIYEEGDSVTFREVEGME